MNRNHPPLLDRIHTEVEHLLSDLRAAGTFTETCQWQGCAATAVWVWRCRVCHVTTYVCGEHDSILRDPQPVIGSKARNWRCGRCETIVSRWPSLFRRVPL